ncbi:hypothetical protein E5D57_009355 [Metarhizium anisopliae]|nr:hypothetical protein E5D57_009355 [Metarhizium anisopliae]
MPSPRLTAVDDLSALSDAQLGEFMEEHRRHDGSVELPIDGWDRLSKGERDRLAERLQSIQRASTNNPTANSHPLDLDKLDALLRDVSAGDDSLSQDRLPARERQTESPEENDQEIYQRRETEAYNNLVHDGGRALYRIDLIDSVSKDPDAYREMLRPFWRGVRCDKLSEDDHLDPRAVFQRQWLRWENFRMWQLVNRRIEENNDEDEFLAYVERTKHKFRKVGWAEAAAEIEADPTILKQPGRGWYYIQRHRDWQRRYQRELGCESTSDYEEAMKARLAKHGFTRTFYLAEDPKQQEKLTTWIEYLGFEYWWLDRYAASIERLKPKHDEAWEELKRKGMVKNDETPEFVRTDASGTRCQREEDYARKAVQDAESEAKSVYQKTQKDPNRLSIPKQRRIEMVVKARKRLLAAQEALDFTKRRSDSLIDFVRGTFDYDDAREDVLNQTNLLEWAVAEAHAIEAELTVATLKRPSQKKRKASSQDVSTAKRQKSNAHKHGPHPSHDTIGKGNRRALRRRNRPSTDIDQQLERHQSHNMHDTYPSQNKLIGQAAEQVPLTESEPEFVTPEGSSRKRRKVAFKDDPLVQSSPKRLKLSSQGHGSQASNNAVGATGMSQQLDQHQNIRDTNSSSQLPVLNMPSRELTQGLRRSSRLTALRAGPGISSATCESHVPNNLGSRYLPVEKLLGKRIRRRGRGRITEYLVKFKGYDGSCNLWTTTRDLPQTVTNEFDQFRGG